MIKKKGLTSSRVRVLSADRKDGCLRLKLESEDGVRFYLRITQGQELILPALPPNMIAQETELVTEYNLCKNCGGYRERHPYINCRVYEPIES